MMVMHLFENTALYSTHLSQNLDNISNLQF